MSGARQSVFSDPGAGVEVTGGGRLCTRVSADEAEGALAGFVG